MLYPALFLALLLASYLFWRYWYVDSQVKSNLADFKADGAANSLGRAYHVQQWLKRACVAAPLCILTAAPLFFSHWYAGVAGLFSCALLLAGVFCRDFTPKLNLARLAAGETHLSEWYASKQSQSWPDKKAWDNARAATLYSTDEQEQLGADIEMRAIIYHAWHGCLVASFVLASGAVYVSLR